MFVSLLEKLIYGFEINGLTHQPECIFSLLFFWNYWIIDSRGEISRKSKIRLRIYWRKLLACSLFVRLNAIGSYNGSWWTNLDEVSCFELWLCFYLIKILIYQNVQFPSGYCCLTISDGPVICYQIIICF